MSKIEITRRHNLGIEAARTEVERIAQRARDDFGARFAWYGDTLRFSRSGVQGEIAITGESLDLSIKLSLLLSAMKGQIEERIVAKIDRNLARHADNEGA